MIYSGAWDCVLLSFLWSLSSCSPPSPPPPLPPPFSSSLTTVSFLLQKVKYIFFYFIVSVCDQNSFSSKCCFLYALAFSEGGGMTKNFRTSRISSRPFQPWGRGPGVFLLGRLFTSFSILIFFFHLGCAELPLFPDLQPCSKCQKVKYTEKNILEGAR